MRAARQTGFTLLEILIAMSLSVLLLGTLTAGMSLVVDRWQDSSSPLETELDASIVFLQIERALLGAMPHGYVDQDTLARNVFFAGGSETLAWVSTVSPQVKQELTAWQLSGEEREGVTLKAVPALADDPAERLELAAGTLILPDFELMLSYLTLDDLGRVEWLEEWDGPDYQSLPMAVRLSFSGGEAVGADDSEIVIPLLHRESDSIEPVDVL